MNANRVVRKYIARKKQADVHELDEDLLNQVIEEEKSFAQQDRDDQEEFANNAATRFRKISRGMAKDEWERIEEEYSDKDKRKREFAKFLRESEKIQNFNETYLNGRKQTIYKFRNVRTDYSFREKDAVDWVKKIARKYYRNRTMEVDTQNIREALPDEIREWLPENIYIEVDEDGRIEKITNRFENKRKTLRKNIANMNLIVLRYNEIAKRVKKDLESQDEKTRLSALVTAVMMETGIRPGKKGNSAMEVVDGQEIEVETFGAVTLEKKHLEFLKDNLVKLEFRGKQGETNIAEIEDEKLKDILHTYANDVLDGSDHIFVTEDGKRIEYQDVKEYIQERWSFLSPTDFRKMKATRETLRSLHEQQEELYDNILEAVENETDSLEEKVASEVSDTLEEALKEARDALSHKDVETTIKHYVNPEVILRFVSQAQVENELREAVITNERYLSFDPSVFVERARDKQSNQLRTALQGPDDLPELETTTKTTLKGILTQLEKDMNIERLFRKLSSQTSF